MGVILNEHEILLIYQNLITLLIEVFSKLKNYCLRVRNEISFKDSGFLRENMRKGQYMRREARNQCIGWLLL